MATRDTRGGSRAMTLTRDGSARTSRTSAPARRRTMPGVKPHVPHSRGRGRLGSQQVVSVRGRRVGTVAAPSRFSAVSALAVPLLVIGIAIAMLLSGVATTQTFTIQQLQSKERELANEVESLNRDLEDRRSAAEIAQRAAGAGMVVAGEPGLVEVMEDGRAEERRPFNPEKVAKIVDVNGEALRQGRASSDDRATRELADALTQVPGGNQAPPRPQQAPQVANVAPYQANVPAGE
ncbi:hypothetical protein QP980_00340 [Corynebacterium coyleae]|uniref:hypothetical protein n=1 Tax=Corynebacterium coyleae TaxID=53374 RepID=UPI00254BF6C2|nr:hypothetical protein [Corynebacterium coyleae]MDK8822318.1 hypothetical protein [Corynebacterium coyleae]